MEVNALISYGSPDLPVYLAPMKPALPQVVGLFNPGDRTPAAPSAPLFPQALPASLSAPAQNPVELGDGQGWLGVAWVAWTKAVQSELEKTQ